MLNLDEQCTVHIVNIQVDRKIPKIRETFMADVLGKTNVTERVLLVKTLKSLDEEGTCLFMCETVDVRTLTS